MGNSLLRSRLHMYKRYYETAELYPANALAYTPIETMSDLVPVHEVAIANAKKAGVLR